MPRWRLVLGTLTIVMMLAAAGTIHASIIAPQPIDFDANDVDRAVAESGAGGANLSPSQSDRQRPSDDDLWRIGSLRWLKSPPPSSGGSSTGSTSSAGGVGMSLCPLSTAITIKIGPAVGPLAEEHGLALPDPPANDLLRPPRAA